MVLPRRAVRIVASGFAAAIAWYAGIVVFFGPAQALLADPERQSPKFLAAFTEEPLPRMADTPAVLPLGLLLIGLVHAVSYAWLAPRLTGSTLRRGASFGVLAWALMVPWFEFYLPWNVMREPLGLALLEAACWLLVLLGVGVAVAFAQGVAASPRAG